jgi:hypothetical protein
MLTHTVEYPYLIDVMIRLHSCGVKGRCRRGTEARQEHICGNGCTLVLCELGIRGQRLYHISARNGVGVIAGASMLGEDTERQAVFVIIRKAASGCCILLTWPASILILISE